MKILVIGGTGFIGQHVCRSLASDHEVLVFARHLPTEKSRLCAHKNIRSILGDVSQSYSISSACAGIDCIAYLASTVIPATSNLDPAFDIQSNLIGAVNTLNAAVRNNVPKFVFLSSGGTVYGRSSNSNINETSQTDPVCSYGIVKLAIEKYILMYHELHGLSCSILRLSNPYGPGFNLDKPQGVIGFFLDKILKNETIEVWGDGSIERDFIYVQDAVIAIKKAILAETRALLLNVGTGVPTSLNELISILGSETGQTPKVRYMPSRSFDVQRSVLDITAAKAVLDWAPQISLRTGIDLMLKDGIPIDQMNQDI